MKKRHNLIRLRKTLGMKQYELADKAGIDRSLMSRFESGERKPDIDQMRAINAALGYKQFDKGGLWDETEDPDQNEGRED